MRRFLILGLLVLGFAVPSLAETAKDLQATIRVRPGNYLVQGRAPDGQTYEGEAQIQSSGPNTWRVAWRVAGTMAQGVGLTVGDALVVGYVIEPQTQGLHTAWILTPAEIEKYKPIQPRTLLQRVFGS